MKFIDTELMEKYLQGKADREEQYRVQMWLMLNLKSRSADGDFEELMERIPAVNDPAGKERVLSNLKTIIAADSRQKSYVRRQKRKNILIGSVMASLCAALAVLAFSFASMRNDMRQIASWTEVTADYGEIREVVLPDGSHIWLHNDTRVVYPDTFTGGRRQVFVSGEIYAEIESDSHCPFVVSADNVNVIVKGTTFNMRSYPETDNVELTLIEGDVDLEYTTSWGKASLDVKKGETVVVNLTNGGIDKFIHEDYVSWKDRRALYFNDKTLSEIAAELEHEFGVRIVISDRDLAYSRHFASFVNNESVTDILHALCGEEGTEIIEKDSTIYISTTN